MSKNPDPIAIKEEPTEFTTREINVCNSVPKHSTTLFIKPENHDSSNYVTKNTEDNLKKSKTFTEGDVNLKFEKEYFKNEKTTDNCNNKPLTGTCKKCLKHTNNCTDEKPLQCDECVLNREYLNKCTINRTVKIYNCNVCDCKCASRNHLKLHMKTHTGEKPFTCEVCQQQFSRISNLKAHKVVHSEREYFSCDFCEYKSKIRSNLKRHMKTHIK